jgi:dipeptide/tripeptide permease
MGVYVMAYPGGIIADDKSIGQKNAVMIGGALLCLG